MAVLSPDGRQVLVATWPDGPMSIFNIWQSREELIELAKECCVFRDLTPEERQQFGLPAVRWRHLNIVTVRGTMAELTDLQHAITVLETQRGVLGDVVVDASVAALRRQLADLDAAPPDEQRKLVTVLFADLAGFTAMCEHMDPEEVRAMQDAYFAAVTKPIEDYGGSVEKYIGDAVLAVFGVPANPRGRRRACGPRCAGDAGGDGQSQPASGERG